MFVYRVFYAWFDSHQHIGLFLKQEDAWLEADKRYKKGRFYEIDFISSKGKRLTSCRRTRYYIVKEEIK